VTNERTGNQSDWADSCAGAGKISGERKIGKRRRKLLSANKYENHRRWKPLMKTPAKRGVGQAAKKIQRLERGHMKEL